MVGSCEWCGNIERAFAYRDFPKGLSVSTEKERVWAASLESGVDSTNARICVQRSPKEGLEVRSFYMVEGLRDLDAPFSVTVSQRKPFAPMVQQVEN